MKEKDINNLTTLLHHYLTDVPVRRTIAEFLFLIQQHIKLLKHFEHKASTGVEIVPNRYSRFIGLTTHVNLTKTKSVHYSPPTLQFLDNPHRRYQPNRRIWLHMPGVADNPTKINNLINKVIETDWTEIYRHEKLHRTPTLPKLIESWSPGNVRAYS